MSKLAFETLGSEGRKGYCSQVEKGQRRLSEGTILNFARAPDLPAKETDPLFDNVLPQTDETSGSDDAASVLNNPADGLREDLKLSDALAIALAYKHATRTPTDSKGALSGLEAALELAPQETARNRLPSNFDQAVNEFIARVEAMNRYGQIDEAYADVRAVAPPFALTGAIGLARKCAAIAPTDVLRDEAENDLENARAIQGSRTA